MTRRRGGTGLPPDPPRVVIQDVTPRLGCGRHAVKRIVGDICFVGADIYKDGHDSLGARIVARGPGQRAWRPYPLEYIWGEDRWAGSFPLDRVGRWEFSIEAWPDVFASWREAVGKKAEAGHEIGSELLEGGAMVREAARRAKGSGRRRLAAAADILEAADLPIEDRLATGLDDALLETMRANLDSALVTRWERTLAVRVDREAARFAAWYEMFPRSYGVTPGEHGDFRSAAEQLPRIAELGFDVVYLPPIHPVGHTKRKGPNNALVAGPDDPGSPWAIGSEAGGHDAIEPRLGTLEDFEAFVARAGELGLEVALDFALQCSPDHPWTREHPDWFFLRPDGTIHYAENPPKKYEDIYPLDFWCDDREKLWTACRDLFFFWIERGVRTFRVDNPHTKPFAFWEWAIESVQARHPDVVFLAEAFTRPKRMTGLAKIGFTQSYTYFTWRNEPWEIRSYLEELTAPARVEYFRPNFFVNTPDILTEFLQKGGRPAFRIRLLLAATLSPLYGVYSGFELCEAAPREPGSEEYLHSEKYEVRWRDWGAPGNLNDDLRVLNRIRREHAALQQLPNLAFLPSDNDRILFYRKWADGADPDHLLIAVNCDPGAVNETMVHMPLADLGLAPDASYAVEDLLTGERWIWNGEANYVRLDPGERVGHVLRVVGRSSI